MKRRKKIPQGPYHVSCKICSAQFWAAGPLRKICTTCRDKLGPTQVSMGANRSMDYPTIDEVRAELAWGEVDKMRQLMSE
jgi:hypothetical protein